jgi:hypothetical protein
MNDVTEPDRTRPSRCGSATLVNPGAGTSAPFAYRTHEWLGASVIQTTVAEVALVATR